MRRRKLAHSFLSFDTAAKVEAMIHRLTGDITIIAPLRYGEIDYYLIYRWSGSKWVVA